MTAGLRDAISAVVIYGIEKFALYYVQIRLSAILY